MKILFTSEAVVEICKGKYHKTSFQPFIERYSYFGKVVFCSYCQNVETSGQSILDTSNVEFLFLEKETNPQTMLAVRKRNIAKLKLAVAECDIVASHLPSPIGFEAISLAIKYNKPYIIGVVGCAWDAYSNYGLKGKLVAIPYFLKMRKYVSKAKYAFYVTEKFLQDRYPCPGLTIGCSNVEITNYDKDVLHNRLIYIKNKELNEIKIATVAAVDVRYKGQEFVIRAIAKLNKLGKIKYHYYLVGGGNNNFLTNVAIKEGMKEFVHFVGPIPHEKVNDFLDEMDIYIQPSRQEGLPRAVIEAMSRALPAFGARTAGIPELLLPECVFENCAVSQIAKMLESLDRDKLIKYAKRNFEEARNYTPEVLNERRLNFYKEIAENEHLEINNERKKNNTHGHS